MLVPKRLQDVNDKVLGRAPTPNQTSTEISVGCEV